MDLPHYLHHHHHESAKGCMQLYSIQILLNVSYWSDPVTFIILMTLFKGPEVVEPTLM